MNKLSFDINKPRDFYNKLKDDMTDYQKSNYSSGKALNCAMTSWHLSDWIYHEYKLDKLYPKLSDYQKKVKEECPSLQIMHDITNGSKHYSLKFHKPETKSTSRREGTFGNTFGSTFNKTRLVVLMNSGDMLNFEDELQNTIDYWDKELNRLAFENNY